MKLERIAVDVDGSEAATCALTFSARLAEQLQATIQAVHVFTTDPARLPGGFATLPEVRGAETR